MPNLTQMTAWAILLVITFPAFADPGSEQEGSQGSTWTENSMLDGDAATRKIQQEIEKVRQDLGAEFSLESQELGISFDRAEPTAETCQPGTISSTSGTPGLQHDTEVTSQLLSISQKTQEQARKLEQLAADAETRMDYQLADRLRELALQQWKTARVIRKPISRTDASCNSCAENTFGLHSLPELAPLPESIPPGVNGPGPGILFPFFRPYQAPSTTPPPMSESNN